ncbi:HupE/UreJ family protein [Pedobacter ginsengisoli]|uniref:HupE/UreJ family protein n=1 Tax=Pedobacter ginsengisoli TaxID=363852 RepID=UPI002550E1BF|nr:HupE/UreJ family protein [Pedobacter ginsengisoli]
MQDFQLYFGLGWHHILDWQGYDHILFLLALCSIYGAQDLKKLLILITAFTLGHSITLALSVWQYIHINSKLIEFLIPVTILITASSNIISKKKKPKKMLFRYLLTLFFGLIHGLGFSNYLKSLMGKSANIVVELLGFNLGLEFGQLLIVATAMLLSFILIWIVKIKAWDWNFFLSSAIFGIAFMMAAERLPAIYNLY